MLLNLCHCILAPLTTGASVLLPACLWFALWYSFFLTLLSALSTRLLIDWLLNYKISFCYFYCLCKSAFQYIIASTIDSLVWLSFLSSTQASHTNSTQKLQMQKIFKLFLAYLQFCHFVRNQLFYLFRWLTRQLIRVFHFCFFCWLLNCTSFKQLLFVINLFIWRLKVTLSYFLTSESLPVKESNSLFCRYPV